MLQEVAANIFQRVRQKKESYRLYNLERMQEEAFATFFDLAQEYTNIDYLYLICVAVPKEFFDVDSRIYVIDRKNSQLQKVCTSHTGLVPENERHLFNLCVIKGPYETDDSWIFPIRGNQALSQWISFLGQTEILGMFEIFPKERVDASSHFFFEKFTNRIGYNLHQKLLLQQNIDHIKFINQLVSDIEHNVISPNLYYKLFLLQLKKNLALYKKVREQLRQLIFSVEENADNSISERLHEIAALLATNNRSLEAECKAVSKHYEHTSLFLETLFRRDHFEKGTYVLKRQSCNFRTEIIQPLLERYIPLFEKRGITVENRFEGVPDEQITLVVDKGLISQVFDNLLSNALKYSREVEDQLGNTIKLVSYNRQIHSDYFGTGINGVRFNFFTTGIPLKEEEAARIFDEGYRGLGASQERGRGHGLHFVRNVIEIHGGKVGCEPQRYGNLFYFILPLKHERPMQL